MARSDLLVRQTALTKYMWETIRLPTLDAKQTADNDDKSESKKKNKSKKKSKSKRRAGDKDKEGAKRHKDV